MEIRGYAAAETLLRTGPFILRRGLRSRDRQAVLLKSTARTAPRRAEVEALERELELLRSLRQPGVPRGLDFIRTDIACLVIEDPGLHPVAAIDAPTRRDLRWSLAIGIALADTLAELHRDNLICGTLSPTTLLVSGAGEPAAVQLIDFSLAARVSLDTTAKATLTWGPTPYIAPEQTGRSNRAIDHRADLYSLGATLYQLLVGIPPFHSDDPLELIHAHLAKTPVAPDVLSEGIPPQISAIVMRLLAKAAEDRYQSANGVKADLQDCLREWTATQTVSTFDLGRHDVSDRFLIPQRLYGRDRELAQLSAAFDSACEGRATLLLVSGYSGIGKTSLISELYKPIVKQRGYFLTGKFDQVMRNTPYGALIQAFRGFVWQVLAESEHGLAEWRTRLSKALGANGGVLAEVIPEIEFVIGKQTPAPVLDSVEAQNRFRYVFQSFVGTVAHKDHPVVIFLDDLQWVDAATLDLLHALLTGPDIHHVLFIGAYRDNEVDANHLLTWAIERLQTAGAATPRVSLGPLALPDIAAFLRETLGSQATGIEPLAALIRQKTDGNPFFVIQFLKTLKQKACCVSIPRSAPGPSTWARSPRRG